MLSTLHWTLVHHFLLQGLRFIIHEIREIWVRWYRNEVKWNLLSCVWLFATPWTVARHAPLSMEFSTREYWSEKKQKTKKKEYWSGLPFSSPGESSLSRDQTQVSCTADRLFSVWAPRVGDAEDLSKFMAETHTLNGLRGLASWHWYLTLVLWDMSLSPKNWVWHNDDILWKVCVTWCKEKGFEASWL